MTVKELKQKLERASDDAIVVLYDGLDEGDMFATDTVEAERKRYYAYCKGDTCVEDVNAETKLFIIAGWGYAYESINKAKDKHISELVMEDEEF